MIENDRALRRTSGLARGRNQTRTLTIDHVLALPGQLAAGLASKIGREPR
jgi:hypothetical protein